jgi:hypothetical protein
LSHLVDEPVKDVREIVKIFGTERPRVDNNLKNIPR